MKVVLARLPVHSWLKLNPEFDTDVARVASRKARSIAVKVGARVTLNFLGCDFDVKVIMTGLDLVESGAASKRQRFGYVEAGGTGLPYFGLIATGPTDDGGLFMGGIACLKLENEGNWRLDGNENKLSTGELMADALSVTFEQGPLSNRVEYSIFDIVRTFEDPDLFIAPTNATTFRAQFNFLGHPTT